MHETLKNEEETLLSKGSDNFTEDNVVLYCTWEKNVEGEGEGWNVMPPTLKMSIANSNTVQSIQWCNRKT